MLLKWLSLYVAKSQLQFQGRLVEMISAAINLPLLKHFCASIYVAQCTAQYWKDLFEHSYTTLRHVQASTIESFI